jgi:hypothetical protein
VSTIDDPDKCRSAIIADFASMTVNKGLETLASFAAREANDATVLSAIEQEPSIALDRLASVWAADRISGGHPFSTQAGTSAYAALRPLWAPGAAASSSAVVSLPPAASPAAPPAAAQGPTEWTTANSTEPYTAGAISQAAPTATASTVPLPITGPTRTQSANTALDPALETRIGNIMGKYFNKHARSVLKAAQRTRMSSRSAGSMSRKSSDGTAATSEKTGGRRSRRKPKGSRSVREGSDRTNAGS